MQKDFKSTVIQDYMYMLSKDIELGCHLDFDDMYDLYLLLGYEYTTNKNNRPRIRLPGAIYWEATFKMFSNIEDALRLLPDNFSHILKFDTETKRFRFIIVSSNNTILTYGDSTNAARAITAANIKARLWIADQD